MLCPGVTDDTANLAVLMLCARFFLRNPPDDGRGVLFVANSCEEGLGNLKGSRQIVADYGARIDEFITLDSSDMNKIVTSAVGSHRYRVQIRTEGGHTLDDDPRVRRSPSVGWLSKSMAGKGQGWWRWWRGRA